MAADEYGDQYDLETLLRRVTSVADPRLRRRQLERHITTVDAPTVAAHLQSVIAGAVLGDLRSQDAVLPLAELVGAPSEWASGSLEAVNLEARKQDHRALGWFLLEPPPARVIDPRAAQRMTRQQQPLGVRRAQAMVGDARTLEQLALDDHPWVIERLLTNLRLPESLVMTIVTRRPTRPELVEQVAQSAKWYSRPVIRSAIAQNPYASTGLALRTLPTLGGRGCEAIRHAPQVHEAVRGFSEYLCRLRDGDPRGPGPESVAPAPN